MSIYSERLARLKKEIVIIKNKLKKKKFKKHQQIMIDFINGVTNIAKFEVKGLIITLHKGDKKKGFIHILEKHYCIGCQGELKTMEILNMIDIIKRGIELKNEGNTNNNLIVYLRNDTKHKLVLKPTYQKTYVVTMYSIC